MKVCKDARRTEKRGANIKHEGGEKTRGDHKQSGSEEKKDSKETLKTVREKESRQAMGEY